MRARGGMSLKMFYPEPVGVLPVAARAAYERALDAYERSELIIERADNRRRMDTARKLVAAGRMAAQQARVASGT